MRLDKLLLEKGHFASREKAKAAIMAGLVRVDGEIVDKAGTKIPSDARLEVAGAPHPYVSRGGLKLEKALDTFQFDMKDAIVIDIGASTGGFTDCALQHGAAHVYAVDVGYGQLDWKLRKDPRVTVMERTNFRYVDKDRFRAREGIGVPDVAVIDVSFISLDKILPVLKDILPQQGAVLALIKPQFEAGKEQVGKKGVVRDPAVHRAVLRRVMNAAAENGFHVYGLTYSPITGSEGNIEFLVHWVRQIEPQLPEDDIEHLIRMTVAAGHRWNKAPN